MIRLALVAALGLQAGEIFEEKVHGRAAWVLSNGKIRVALLKGGGHIAEVRQLTGDPKRDVNPMRVPHYPTIDPHTFDDAKHQAIYGEGSHRWLSSGYMGHLLCFPNYGPVSPEEAALGLGNHGEAPVVEWKKTGASIDSGKLIFEYTAELPKTKYRVGRRVTLRDGAYEVDVEEWVENLLPLDRPMQWMQHATFGPPFIQPGKSVMRISTRDGVIQRTMPPEAKTGSYTAIRTDPARSNNFFVMSSPDFPIEIGYVFPAAQNPWVGDWMENQRNEFAPWNGKVIARGIEFGNSPYAEGLRKAIDRATHESTPAYGWIAGRQTLRNSFRIVLAEPSAGRPFPVSR